MNEQRHYHIGRFNNVIIRNVTLSKDKQDINNRKHIVCYSEI